jgi:TonB family protein
VETTINVNYTFAPEPSGPSSDESTAQPSTGQSIPISSSVRISSGIAAGMLISRVEPVFPPNVSAGPGPVVLKVIISKTGIVKDVQVISGPPGLLPTSIDAVKQWKYTPYLLNGEPIEVQTTVVLSVGFSRYAEMPDPDLPREYAGEPLRQIRDEVKPPMVIYQVNPEFSDQAKKAKSPGGTILLNLIVDKQGLPQNVRVVRGVGMGLDEKALEAVRQYRFKPGMEGGTPVPVELNIEVNFARF